MHMFNLKMHTEVCQRDRLWNADRPFLFGFDNEDYGKYGPHECKVVQVHELNLLGVPYRLHLTQCVMGYSSSPTMDGIRTLLSEIGHELRYFRSADIDMLPRGVSLDDVCCIRGEFGRCYAIDCAIDEAWHLFWATKPCAECGNVASNMSEWREFERLSKFDPRYEMFEKLDINLYFRIQGTVKHITVCSEQCQSRVYSKAVDSLKKQEQEVRCLSQSAKALRACRSALRTGNLDALKSHRAALKQALSSQDS